MPNITSIGVTSGIGSSGTGTVSTIDAMFAAAGTPSATNVQTVQTSTNNFNVVISSGTIASISSGTVAISSITGGTITIVGTVTSLTSGTVFVSSGILGTVASVSSGTISIANGANVASVKAANTAASSQDLALVVALSPNNPVTTSPATNNLFTVIASAGTNATLIQNTTTVVYGGHFYNNAATPVFVRLYNSSVAPTPGSSQFLFNIGVSPGAVRDCLLAGSVSSKGLGYTITAGVTSTSTSAVSADDVQGVIEYR